MKSKLVVLTSVGAWQVVPGIRLFDDILMDLVPLTLSVTPGTERWDRVAENKVLLWIFYSSAIKYRNSQGQIAKRKVKVNVPEVNIYSMVGPIYGKSSKFPIMLSTEHWESVGIYTISALVLD